MAIQADDGGQRPEPGLARALLSVFTMVLTTAILFVLIYLLMLGVSATSQQGSSQGGSATNASPSPVASQPRQKPAPTVPSSQPIAPPPQTQ